MFEATECEFHPGEERPCMKMCVCWEPCHLHEPDGLRMGVSVSKPNLQLRMESSRCGGFVEQMPESEDHDDSERDDNDCCDYGWSDPEGSSGEEA